MNLSKVIEQTMVFRETLANEECLSTSTQDKQSFITMGIVYVFNGKCFSWSRYLLKVYVVKRLAAMNKMEPMNGCYFMPINDNIVTL